MDEESDQEWIKDDHETTQRSEEENDHEKFIEDAESDEDKGDVEEEADE